MTTPVRAKPVNLLAAVLLVTSAAFVSCARTGEMQQETPEPRDIGPGLWRFFEPLADGEARDPLLERVKELAARLSSPKSGREKAGAPEHPAGEGFREPEAASVAAPPEANGEGAHAVPHRAAPLAGMALLELGTGDEIDIAVGGRPEFSDAVLVREDGKIALPATGDLVQAAGLTAGRLAEALAEALHPRYLKRRPEVSVSLRSSPRLIYYIFGAVRRPGRQSMPPEGITVLDAVLAASRSADDSDATLRSLPAAAGKLRSTRVGFEPVRGARYGRVHVVTPSGKTGGGVSVKIVDLREAFQGGRGSREVVPPGSHVIVPGRRGPFSEAALKKKFYPEGLASSRKAGDAR